MRDSHLVARLCSLSALAVACALVVSCSDDDDDTTADDAGADASAPEDSGARQDAGELTDFPLRPLQAHDVDCSDGGDATFYDVDYVCHVTYEAIEADVYFQSTPTDCGGALGTPVYGDVRGWTKVDGVVAATEATYSWGGGHHNERLQFVLNGDRYTVWHSSFGFGFRECAPPDCLLPCDEGTTFETCDEYAGYSVDGCARDPGGPAPPLPVICVAVNADGTVPPLDDPWEAHGDTPALLPCLGDM